LNYSCLSQSKTNKKITLPGVRETEMERETAESKKKEQINEYGRE